jgi:hypothetical protein
MQKKAKMKQPSAGKRKSRKPADLPVKKGDKVKGGLRRTGGLHSASVTGASILV